MQYTVTSPLGLVIGATETALLWLCWRATCNVALRVGKPI